MKQGKKNILVSMYRFWGTAMLLLFFPAEHGLAALIDNNDGTVTDTVTCLQWQQDSMDLDGDGTPDEMIWDQALAASQALSLAGYTDWRLPDISELISIVDYSQHAPAINKVIFPEPVPSDFWSSTTSLNPGQDIGEDPLPLAKTVEFFSGRVYFSIKDNRSNRVRAVRGGQCGYSVISGAAGMNGSLDNSTPSPQSVAKDSVTQFIFNASAGYYVASVNGCGVSYNNTDDSVSSYTATTGIITDDCTVSARFSKPFTWTMFLPAIINNR